MSLNDSTTAAEAPHPGNSALLEPEEHVLSTLEADGSRRWLTPRLAKGRFWKRRRVVAYFLLALYSGLPWLRINGMPAILLDIPQRRFVFFGGTFLPTDTVLLALTVLTIFLSIFFLTAVLGRVWCGWACPQTVYLEFVFRPLERVFYGRTGKGGKPRKEPAAWRKAAMYATFFVICLHLCQTFIAYFVGVDAVQDWIWHSPLEHPVAFGIVAAITLLMMIDFAYWREQLCIIGCPYGRLQSVLLDRSSVIVSYDPQRGEPRGRVSKRADPAEAQQRGDCVDCGLCVQVCPTGIDIRDGLQLECVHCTQCIDACAPVMEKLGREPGLIRYSSQSAIDGEPTRIIRPRVLLYAGLILALSTTLLVLLSTKAQADVTILRSLGMPFVQTDAGLIQNTMRLKLRNRTDATRVYVAELVEPQDARIQLTLSSIQLESGQSRVEPLLVLCEPSVFDNGPVEALVRITDDTGWSTDRRWKLLGTRRPKSEQVETNAESDQ